MCGSSSSAESPMVTGDGDLGELTALVRKGEERVVFQHPSMPSSIQRHIHDENLQFMQHKEVYTPGYFNFIKELVDTNLVRLCGIGKEEGRRGKGGRGEMGERRERGEGVGREGERREEEGERRRGKEC